MFLDRTNPAKNLVNVTKYSSHEFLCWSFFKQYSYYVVILIEYVLSLFWRKKNKKKNERTVRGDNWFVYGMCILNFLKLDNIIRYTIDRLCRKKADLPHANSEEPAYYVRNCVHVLAGSLQFRLSLPWRKVRRSIREKKSQISTCEYDYVQFILKKRFAVKILISGQDV